MPLNEILAPTNISNTGNVFPGLYQTQITTLTNGTFALIYVDSVDGTEAVWKIFDAQGALIETGGTPADFFNLEADPDIAALSGGGFALSWEDDNYDANLVGEIVTAAYSAQGAVLVPPSNVTNTADVSEQFSKVAALENDTYVVTWQSRSTNSDIYAAIYNSQGEVVPPVNVSGIDSIHDQRPSVAVSSDGSSYLLCWTAVAPGGDSEIYTAVYTAQGVEVSAAKNVSVNTGSGDGEVQATALVNGGYALTWSRGVLGGGTQIMTAIYDNLGQVVVAPFPVGSGLQPHIATLTDGNYALFWTDTVDNYTAVYDAQGQQVLAPVPVSTADGGDYAADIVALSNGAYALTWENTEGSNNDVFVADVFIAVYDAQGQQVAPLNISNSAGLADGAPTITALADGAFAVAWQGQIAGAFLGDEFLAIYQFVDPTAPVITGFSPDTGTLGDHITEAHDLVVSGTAPLDAVKVTVSDGHGHDVQVTPGIGGVWSAPFNALALGGYDFTATAVDEFDNVSDASSVFHLEIAHLVAPPLDRSRKFYRFRK